MTAESLIDSELTVGRNDDLFNDIYKKQPESAYTNFVVDGRSLWYCPKCHWRTHTPHRWALIKRGYAKIPKNYPGAIHASYGSDYTNGLYFQNPAGVVRCQNYWDMGFSGSRCTFNREEAEGYRDMEREEMQDKMRGEYLNHCSQCSVSPHILDRNPEHKAFIENETGIETIKKGRPVFRVYINDPWMGKPRVIRSFMYDGSEESLQCCTTHFGEGSTEKSKDKSCPGRYGGPVIFYVNEYEEEIGRRRKMVETGQFIDENDMDKDNRKKEPYATEWVPDEAWWERANDSSASEEGPIDYIDSTTSSSSWSSYGQALSQGYTSS
ncbi:Nn.00g045120.m01.CDS01 [Neocucurbitaria sp. VM-36]